MEEEKQTGGWAINFKNNRWGGAGVVIYSYASKERGAQQCQEEAYILARKKIMEGGVCRYDQFGGKRNKGEKDPRVTASREFEEETWGALCSAEEIRKFFFDYDSETNLPSSSLTFSAGHLEFYVKRPYDEEVGVSFDKIRAEKNPTSTKKLSLEWLPVSAIRKSIQEYINGPLPSKGVPIVVDGNTSNMILRRHFAKLLLAAEKVGLLAQIEGIEEVLKTQRLEEL